MRAPLLVLAVPALLLFLSPLACSSSSDDEADPCAAAASGATSTPANPAECPAELPAQYSACSPRGLRCTYPGKGTADANGCKKPATVQCIVEGPDSGTSKSPTWWPQP